VREEKWIYYDTTQSQVVSKKNKRHAIDSSRELHARELRVARLSLRQIYHHHLGPRKTAWERR
jgi:hypothetical protein